MPLPSRPPQPNREPAEAPASSPKLGDFSTTPPAGFEERVETPRMAAPSNEAPQNAFTVPAFKNPLQASAQEEEYLPEDDEIPAPLVDEAPEAPQSVLPTVPPVVRESPAEDHTAAIQDEFTPVPTVKENVPATPLATTRPEPAREPLPAQPMSVPAAEENIQMDDLPYTVKTSIARLFEHLLDDESSEVVLNAPNKVGFKKNGQRFFDNEINFGDVDTYHYVINNFLLPMSNTEDRIGVRKHLIEGQLRVPDEENPGRPPMIARMTIIAPPVVEAAIITIAKKARDQFTIDSLVQTGSMNAEMGEFLKAAAKGRLTIVFSGLSGSGKTTLLQAMSRDFDVNDRVILIEDTEELTINVSDIAALTSTQARPGEDANNAVTLEWLVRQANRMRPDRIIVGEVRGPEMSEFLVAANSGADGSMTTVHAGTPQLTINKIANLAGSHTTKSEASIYKEIASTVQLIVQMTLVDGKHIISHIEEVSNTVVNNGTSVATNTIFSYDRNTGTFNSVGRPSDELKNFLAQRGVTLVPQTRPSQFGGTRF